MFGCIYTLYITLYNLANGTIGHLKATRNVVSWTGLYSIELKAASNDAGFSGCFRTNVLQNPRPPHQQVLKVVRHEDWHFSGLQEEVLSLLVTDQPEPGLDIV